MSLVLLIGSVALRKESVDRNYRVGNIPLHIIRVALRKESVDRNLEAVSMVRWTLPSLSARRAWIEIGIGGAKTMAVYSRSPQGERG